MKIFKNAPRWIKQDEKAQHIVIFMLENVEKLTPEGLGILHRKSFNILHRRFGVQEYSELEHSVKPCFGKILENQYRSTFNLVGQKKGLDFLIDGIEIDMKSSTGGHKCKYLPNSFQISLECTNKLALLISLSDYLSVANLGIIRCYGEESPGQINTQEYNFLSPFPKPGPKPPGGPRRDFKRTLNSEGKKNIFWIYKKIPIPTNPWFLIPEGRREQYLSEKQELIDRHNREYDELDAKFIGGRVK